MTTESRNGEVDQTCGEILSNENGLSSDEQHWRIDNCSDVESLVRSRTISRVVKEERSVAAQAAATSDVSNDVDSTNANTFATSVRTLDNNNSNRIRTRRSSEESLSGTSTSFLERHLTPFRMLWIFTFINFWNYLDRGIIPGSLDHISSFIHEEHISPDTKALVGLLQSSFIGGYALACVVFGRLVHYFSPFRLMSVGLFVWCLSVMLSGFAPNYYVLILARTLSGVGEASFQTIAPPFIDDRAPLASKGLWLAIFFIAIPVGTAAGYSFGGIISNSSLTWRSAFLLEIPFTLPFALFCWFIPEKLRYRKDIEEENDNAEQGYYTALNDENTTPKLVGFENLENAENNNNEVCADDALRTNVSNNENDNCDDMFRPQLLRTPTLVEELKGIFASRVYIFVVLGYACWTFTVQGFGTFGASFVMGLGMVNGNNEEGWNCQRCTGNKSLPGCTPAVLAPCDGLESKASIVFGAIIAGAGLISTTAGGWLLDWLSPPNPTQKMLIALRLLTCITFAGALLCILASCMEHSGAFFSVLAGALLFLLATSSGVNIAIMWSVPEESRSFAIGISTLIMHALGDVPGPAIIGYLLDKMVPGTATTAEANHGLRNIMRLLTAWLCGTIIFWGTASCIVHYNIRSRKRLR
eukprot:g4684.t1